MAAGRSPAGGGDQPRVTELSVWAFTTGASGACRGGLLGAEQNMGPCHQLGTPSPSLGPISQEGEVLVTEFPALRGGGTALVVWNGHSPRGLPAQECAVGPAPRSQLCGHFCVCSGKSTRASEATLGPGPPRAVHGAWKGTPSSSQP